MNFEKEKEKLIKFLEDSFPDTPSYIFDAFKRVPRHIFVGEEFKDKAYEDVALPIGHHQTISRPSTILKMLSAIQPTKKDKVLEIGTGSGYQTAILAELSRFVFSIEKISGLGKKAVENLKSLGYTNFSVNIFDGGYGWPKFAPYDCIIVSCGSSKMPKNLLNQLRKGGRMIIPKGEGRNQQLYLITRDEKGFIYARLDKVSFVPFITDSSEI